jgi:hypothetical protein
LLWVGFKALRRWWTGRLFEYESVNRFLKALESESSESQLWRWRTEPQSSIVVWKLWTTAEEDNESCFIERTNDDGRDRPVTSVSRSTGDISDKAVDDNATDVEKCLRAFGFVPTFLPLEGGGAFYISRRALADLLTCTELPSFFKKER